MSHEEREPEWDFPGCRSVLDSDTWRRVISTCGADDTPDRFLEEVRIRGRRSGAPECLPELARLEWHLRRLRESEFLFPDDPDASTLNPSLHLIELGWKNLASFPNAADGHPPEPGAEFVILWKEPGNGGLRRQAATEEDLRTTISSGATAITAARWLFSRCLANSASMQW